MLTAWARQIISVAKYADYYIPYVSVSYLDKAYIPAKRIDGTSIYVPPRVYSSNSFPAIVTALAATGSSSSSGVAFGSDATPPTENDYTLGRQVTGITCTASPIIKTVIDEVSGRYVARLDYPLANDTAEDVTIAEIGLFHRFASADALGGTPATSTRCSIMFDRTVLETPVVIPAGAAGTVRYQFSY